jgi:hypothetical protein
MHRGILEDLWSQTASQVTSDKIITAIIDSIPSCRVGVENRVAQRIGIGVVVIGNFIKAVPSLPAE